MQTVRRSTAETSGVPSSTLQGCLCRVTCRADWLSSLQPTTDKDILADCRAGRVSVEDLKQIRWQNCTGQIDEISVQKDRCYFHRLARAATQQLQAALADESQSLNHVACTTNWCSACDTQPNLVLCLKAAPPNATTAFDTAPQLVHQIMFRRSVDVQRRSIELSATAGGTLHACAAPFRGRQRTRCAATAAPSRTRRSRSPTRLPVPLNDSGLGLDSDAFSSQVSDPSHSLTSCPWCLEDVSPGRRQWQRSTIVLCAQEAPAANIKGVPCARAGQLCATSGCMVSACLTLHAGTCRSGWVHHHLEAAQRGPRRWPSCSQRPRCGTAWTGGRAQVA